ncbi:MAG TPA: penicillin-binding protein activator [Fibrobacteraceae bacterium]|nr:penicillin-binding protein activator [Fibrobacteraceae bacterium]
MKQITLLLLLLSSAFAAKGSSPKENWAISVKAIQAARYNDAIPPLEAIVQRSWSTPLGEKACALLVESSLQAKNGKKASWYANRFLESHPTSPYRDRVETALAMQKILDHNVFTGIEDLIHVLAYSKNPPTYARAKATALQVLAASLLGSGEMQSLVDAHPDLDAEVLAFMNFQLGREYQKEGRWKAARFAYSRVLKANTFTPLGESARQGIFALEERGPGTPTVIVLAPLSGDYAELGQEMVQGIVLAYEEFCAKNDKKKLLLRIVDDNGDAVHAIRRVQNVVMTDAVVGIIGPMMSHAATAVAAWLGESHPEIAMITPTATDEGISSLGDNIFQMNVPTAAMARAIATYSFSCLNARDFAIISPLGDYGRILSDEFSKTVESLGGQVRAMQYYEEGAADFQTELNRVRGQKLDLDNRRRNIARGLRDADAMSSKTRKEYLDDSVLTFDAIFIPAADPTDAATMVSHLAFNKLGGILLGSSGWYGKPLLGDNKRLVEGAFFSVPFTETSDDSAYKRFASAFANRWDKAQPEKDKVSGLSYDAMRILLDSWLNMGEGDLPSAIKAKRVFPGVYGSFEFNRDGVNTAQHILTVQKGKFALSDNCPAPQKQTKRK